MDRNNLLMIIEIKEMYKKTLFLLLLLLAHIGWSQQDPQYTQYMYNTMSINPGYTGSKGHTTILALGRVQWVNFPGAPRTQVLSYDSSLGYSRVGLGFNLINDELGPAQETYLDVNASYSLKLNEDSNLSFGLKLGGRLLDIDRSRSIIKHQNDLSIVNINNKFLPTIGAGFYYYTQKMYLGLSVPNILRTEHYDDVLNGGQVSTERLHFFLIGGVVFDLNDDIKFKPAFLFKGVSGAPVSLDISANFLFNNKFRAGLAWRWDDSISALLGFQVNERFHIGYAYDLTTSNYSNYNSGTHELMLRYEIFKDGPVVSPRFF